MHLQRRPHGELLRQLLRAEDTGIVNACGGDCTPAQVRYIIGYSAAVYAPERGLQPVGDWPNLLAYGTFYAAVVGASIATVICLTSAIAVAKGRR